MLRQPSSGIGAHGRHADRIPVANPRAQGNDVRLQSVVLVAEPFPVRPMPVVTSLIRINPSRALTAATIFRISAFGGKRTRPEELPGSKRNPPILSKGMAAQWRQAGPQPSGSVQPAQTLQSKSNHASASRRWADP